jgi:peptidoglycan/LPS O-acetylase OafA/YrhL
VGEIDALRGIAAVAVMLFHYTTRVSDLYPVVGRPLIEAPYGHYGVNLFFIVSGYVIFMTLQRTRKPMDFVVSRVSRLYPAYWTAVVLTFAVTTILGLPGKQVTWVQALGNLLMFQGLFGIPSVDSVYWTLEVELLFYVGMFGLYLLGSLQRIHTVLWGLLALRGVYFAAASWAGIELPWRIYSVLILAYIPWFAIGIAVHLLVYPRKQSDRRASLTLWLGAAGVLGVVAGPAIGTMAAAFGGVVWAAATGRLPWLAQPVMLWLGAISYTLYLLHENIGWSVLLRLHGLGVPRDLGILLAMALSLGLATGVTRLVELPAMAWIRRRYKERKVEPQWG